MTVNVRCCDPKFDYRKPPSKRRAPLPKPRLTPPGVTTTVWKRER